MSLDAWMLHDGTYRAVIRPFRSRAEAEAWRGEFCLTGFVAEPIAGDRTARHAAAARDPARAGRFRRVPSPSANGDG